MKFKLLLFFLLVSVLFVSAQKPYQNLIFSEVRMDNYHHSYVELCNMGTDSVDLGQFDVGNVSPWSVAPWDTVNTFSRTADGFVRLPSKKLGPGETYIIATVRDWGDEQAILHPLENTGSNTKHDMWLLADLQIHASESPDGDKTDSVSTGANALVCWGGAYCFYLMHHYTRFDSVVVDAVNGIFTDASSQRPKDYGASDVAGVPDATGNSILVRKSNVTKGSIDWEKSRGVDITDSEWLPVPTLSGGGWEQGRKEFWTIGNHGNYRLTADRLKSSTIKIDWTKKTMDVDWGSRRQDSIMNEFEYTEGIAWKYVQSSSKLDSAYTSVRTGDSLTLYACGNQLDIIKFGLNLLPPVTSECRVLPKNRRNNNGTWYTPYVVTEIGSGMDTIFAGYSERVDTLLKYLEKPEKAKWEIVWVDGVKRPDLKRGDKLKVTAENNSSVKEYFIKVQLYIPSHNANLASITWPDIPEDLKGIYGWKGDTIPDFSPTKYNYVVKVPSSWNGIPALVAKPEDPDCKIEVVRATSLFGTEDAKTVKFYTTAEDDTTLITYRVRFEKETDVTSNAQPFSAEPFFSDIVFRAGWRQFFLEICNPGNQPLDLSYYVITRTNNLSPAAAINAFNTETSWANRFQRYVPGFVWQDEASWQVQPGILQPDLSVNPIVEGGDVFVLAWAFPNDKDATTYLYPAYNEIDVNFRNTENPWGIEFNEDSGGLANYSNICGGWYNDDWILYKIVGDSVREGLKPLGDPYDVEVIDILGRCSNAAFGLMQAPSTNFDQNQALTRLPHIYKGNPEPGGSFLDTITGRPSEWFWHTESYWAAHGFTYPETRGMLANDIGSQELDPITEFISTVSSVAYTVSKGYSLNETISGGVVAGIPLSDLKRRLIFIEGQTITFTRGETVLSDADPIQNGDQLTVVSRNKNNTTRYTIVTSSIGLDNNAALTSTKYTVTITGATGTISNFEPTVTLREVFENCTPPANASLYGAFKADGSYAPFVQMKHDSTYSDVLASENVFFEVIAQDGETKITYQLKPNSKSTDAYVLSEVYDIDQTALIIKLIPDGTSVEGLFKYLIPAPGATFILQNNAGQVRADGTIYEDDKLIVTAADGTTKKTYTIELWSDYAARYEAYVYSDIYQVVNATSSKINGVSAETSVEAFLANITFSEGATYVLLDNKGNPKSTATMANNDRVVVTSENGKTVRTYRVGIKTSVVDITKNNVFAYPNPTTGFVTVSGLENGNIIRVVNISGQVVMVKKVVSSRESLSLNTLPNGFYLINVDNNNQQIAKIKVIKK